MKREEYIVLTSVVNHVKHEGNPRSHCVTHDILLN